ncbi:MAG: fibrobacter succinogenes major paralogous domain-containing protein [Bacteroidales bacterium]|nr:fibrobacter succinogenes major paralogous domain-containing protein [Bacteroidales bacterium]
MKHTLLYLLILMLSVHALHAQVSINDDGSSPDSSAILDVNNTDKGMLIPRMTTTQRDAISSPAVYLMIYNTDASCMQIYVDSQWNNIHCFQCAPEIVSQPSGQQVCDGGTATIALQANGSNLIYQWQESTDGGSTWSDLSDGGSNPAYSGATTSSLMLTNVPASYDTYQYRCVVSGDCSPDATSNTAELGVCGDDVTFTYNGSTVTYGTVCSAGECWLDRNLGASQVATATDDSQAYGDLYQWGRAAEGHEDRTSSTTSTNATTAVPNDGNSWDGKFIYEPSGTRDWLSTQDDNLWQGVSGTNNPCPSGYRLPTEAEWETERQSWSSNDAAGAFASPLKLPVAGYRYRSSGSFLYVGSVGYYRSSTVDGIQVYLLHIFSNDAYMRNDYRAHGFSVRCLKD